MLKHAYDAGQDAALEKLAGGPGSGVKGYNTASLDSHPRSPFVSVGTRKALLENMPYHKEVVPISKITHVAQDRVVPKKIQFFLANPKLVTENPVDLLKVGDSYHICDGHHRWAAALKLGIQELPAKVYVKRAEGEPEFEDGEDFEEETD